MLSMKKDYHIHCNYNDHSSPDLTIPNVVKYGENIGLIGIDFTEHVRKISDWIPQYLKEIEHIRSDRVKIIAGV
jgi:putative hydrolase